MSEIKLEVGKSYKNGFGSLVDIVQFIYGRFVDSKGVCYNHSGKFNNYGRPSRYDLIEEVK